jgi:hypothetical protein
MGLSEDPFLIFGWDAQSKNLSLASRVAQCSANNGGWRVAALATLLAKTGFSR